MFSFDFRFSNLPQKKITIDNIKEFMSDEDTKRINFASSHQNALKIGDENTQSKLKLPFGDTINPIIENKMGSDKTLFSSKYGGVWRGIKNDSELSEFQEFISSYKDVVFLRDNLDLSLALSMNFENEAHTRIGNLEYQAKFNNDRNSENELISICKDWITELPFYKNADYICAMPCSNPLEGSLPKRIVNSLNEYDFENISDEVIWKNKTKKIKEAGSVEDKLNILIESDLLVSKNLTGKNVILFDDLYMSGISLQYVAMKLKEAGAIRVFGLCLVKSLSNTAR